MFKEIFIFNFYPKFFKESALKLFFSVGAEPSGRYGIHFLKNDLSPRNISAADITFDLRCNIFFFNV